METAAEKVAAAAMLRLTEAERARLTRDLAEIAAMAAQLGAPERKTECVERPAAHVAQLRPDSASAPDTERRMLRGCGREEDGCVRVARTVG